MNEFQWEWIGNDSDCIMSISPTRRDLEWLKVRPNITPGLSLIMDSYPKKFAIRPRPITPTSINDQFNIDNDRFFQLKTIS